MPRGWFSQGFQGASARLRRSHQSPESRPWRIEPGDEPGFPVRLTVTPPDGDGTSVTLDLSPDEARALADELRGSPTPTARSDRTFVPAPLLDLPAEAVVAYLRAQHLDVVIVDAGGIPVADLDGRRVTRTDPPPEQRITAGGTVTVTVE